jgi:hypothetical protein
MSEFEFISVLYSIVIAFPLSEIMAGWGKMIRRRHVLKLYLPHIGAMFLTAMLLIQFWWAIWQYRDDELTFLTFFIVLLAPLTFVLLGSVVTPELESESPTDMEAYYWQNFRFIYGLAALTLAELAIADWFVDNEQEWNTSNVIRIVATGLVASLSVIGRETYHRIMVAVLTGLLILYIAFGSATLAEL